MVVYHKVTNDSNATLKYLVTKRWATEGNTIFSGISTYHDNGPTYKIDFDSNSGGSTIVSSSVDTEIIWIGWIDKWCRNCF